RSLGESPPGGGRRHRQVGRIARDDAGGHGGHATVPEMRAPYRVGLIGLGNVGGALARRLVDDADRIADTSGRPIVLEAIAVAHRDGRSAPAPLVSAEALLKRPNLDAVIELMGGLEPAHTYIYTALQSGRQVITANKQLIAASGPELCRLGPLRFEASVASAIPIVETLAETMASDRITSLRSEERRVGKECRSQVAGKNGRGQGREQ